MKNVKKKVVVITGASSGLGKAAAIRFARGHHFVVLAARRGDALDDVAADCRRAGGEALVVETDVTDEAAVKQLADRALEAAGRIDVWVNNAGVTTFALLEDGPFEDHRRVFETNVYGSIFGARAVIPIFRRQHAGILINVGSVLSKIGQPYVPSYVISKFAIRGLSEALRTSVADEPNIHVCTLLPYAFDTEHFETGANHVGLDPHPMSPGLSPEVVADALVGLAYRPRRERVVPRYAALGLLLHELAPDHVERALLALVREYHFGHDPVAPTQGNLFRPKGRGRVHGKRPPRASLPRMLAWYLFGKKRKTTSLAPHAQS